MKNFQIDLILIAGIQYFKKRLYLPTIPIIGDILIVPLNGVDYTLHISNRMFLMNHSYYEPDHGEVHSTASISVMATWSFGRQIPDLTKAGFEKIAEP